MTPCQWPLLSPHLRCPSAAAGTANLYPTLALGKPLSPTLSLFFTEWVPPDCIPALHSSPVKTSPRKLQAPLIPSPLETILPTSSLLMVSLSGIAGAGARCPHLQASPLFLTQSCHHLLPVFVWFLFVFVFVFVGALLSSSKQPCPGGGRRCETLIRWAEAIFRGHWLST